MLEVARIAERDASVELRRSTLLPGQLATILRSELPHRVALTELGAAVLGMDGDAD
jgi:hypothetical protein